MPVQSTSYQFSASYGTSVAWKREAPSGAPVTPEDVENAAVGIRSAGMNLRA